MKTLLYKQEKGHLGQYEDWWYLVQPEDGAPYVEHLWDQVSVGLRSAEQWFLLRCLSSKRSSKLIPRQFQPYAIR